MMFGFIDPDNKVIRFDSDIDPTVATRSGYKWLPVEEAERPAYSPSTHNAVTSYVITDDKIIQTWEVTELSENEKYVLRTNKINSVDQIALLIFLDLENKYRQLTDQPPISLDEYKKNLTKLC